MNWFKDTRNDVPAHSSIYAPVQKPIFKKNNLYSMYFCKKSLEKLNHIYFALKYFGQNYFFPNTLSRVN
jgi:hypothetical protein